MKKTVVNVLCSTGITLVVLAIIATMSGARFLLISSVFQCLAANGIIHTGLLLTHKFESSFAVLEYMLDIGYTIAVVIVSGAVFNWYSCTPIWVLFIMSAIIYFAGVLLNIFHMRRDIGEINTLLKKRNNKPASKEA